MTLPDAATDLLKLAQQLELERAASPTPHTKEEIAHFLIRIVFCLFADSIGLIPNNVFRSLVESSRSSRINFNKKLPILFEAMSQEGSFFGADDIPWFNGGVFNNAQTIELNNADCDILRKAAKHDWSQIEPSIFGTLFERSLDAAKRSMIGAHYTSPEDILLLVDPVVMTPLRRDWTRTRAAIEEALAAEEEQTQRRNLRANRPASKLLTEWAEKLSKVRILDPACGSGNFLYIAMKQLLDLWQEARGFGLKQGLILPVESMPTPAQLYGIELDFYAHEIASAVVWIGLLQWKRDHSYNDQPKPILHKLANIEHADAILRYNESLKSDDYPNGEPYEPVWPTAEFIVGNPPFLHGSKLRRELGDTLVEDLFSLYRDRVAGAADLVCYWLEKGRAQVVSNATQRVGFIATQAIRGGASQKVLGRIEDTASIFYAWSDRNWLLDGATVHVSFIAFDIGDEQNHTLNNTPVKKIHRDLSAGFDLTTAKSLGENLGVWAYGSQTKAPLILVMRLRKRFFVPSALLDGITET
ncbi:DNA methyltransferase [Granulicella arctica]|uniref:DNA methyltransferase n=1 Tax=Granulicella arctica TaxID=940613 RepID=UPI0021DF6D6C|nr:DNA methyltransferase [Granulicella arctica]